MSDQKEFLPLAAPQPLAWLSPNPGLDQDLIELAALHGVPLRELAQRAGNIPLPACEHRWYYQTDNFYRWASCTLCGGAVEGHPPYPTEAKSDE